MEYLEIKQPRRGLQHRLTLGLPIREREIRRNSQREQVRAHLAAVRAKIQI